MLKEKCTPRLSHFTFKFYELSRNYIHKCTILIFFSPRLFLPLKFVNWCFQQIKKKKVNIFHLLPWIKTRYVEFISSLRVIIVFALLHVNDLYILLGEINLLLLKCCSFNLHFSSCKSNEILNLPMQRIIVLQPKMQIGEYFAICNRKAHKYLCVMNPKCFYCLYTYFKNTLYITTKFAHFAIFNTN